MRSWLPFIVRARPFHAMWLTGVLRGAGSGLVDGLLVVAGPETGTACGLGLGGRVFRGVNRNRPEPAVRPRLGAGRMHTPPHSARCLEARELILAQWIEARCGCSE